MRHIKNILFILTLGFLTLNISSCKMLKEVPVQAIEKVVYRDSLIYVRDSIRIEVPYEVVKEKVYVMDTSVLKTTFAESVAYVDTAKKQLVHTLEQKGSFKVEYDTIIDVQYKEVTIEKEVPIRVEIIKYKRDALFWVLVGWAVVCILFIVSKLYFFKS